MKRPNRGPLGSLSVRPRHPGLQDLKVGAANPEAEYDFPTGTPMLDRPFSLPMDCGKGEPPRPSKTIFRAD